MMPLLLAATCALKSEILSDKFLVPLIKGFTPDWLFIISVIASSWNYPSFTILKLSIAAPSSSSTFEKLGMLPGYIPPISA